MENKLNLQTGLDNTLNGVVEIKSYTLEQLLEIMCDTKVLEYRASKLEDSDIYYSAQNIISALKHEISLR